MSTGYDRPERDPAADPCAYTSYDRGRDVDYVEKSAADGEVPQTGQCAEGLERRVWQALYGVEDPEMPVSIVDLGLLYGVDVDEAAGTAGVEMTLTYTGCPARDMLLGEVERAVADVDGVDEVELALVWSPGWTVDMVTDHGRESLREFGLSV
jgi:metal-sulfur cluster biosynthetic enzyme